MSNVDEEEMSEIEGVTRETEARREMSEIETEARREMSEIEARGNEGES